MKSTTICLLSLWAIALHAAPTWEDIVADDRILPAEVTLSQKTTIPIETESGPIGNFTLEAGSVVAVDETTPTQVIVRYPARVTLPGIERKSFSEVQPPPGEDKLGKAILRLPMKIQVAGPNGTPGPLLQLIPKAVLPISAASESHVTVVMPLLRGPIDWQITDILRRAVPLQQELNAERARRAAESTGF